MPEIKPDLSDLNRCISVHWSIPVQCVLHRTHAEVWHETWHPGTGNRIRYDRASHSYLTEELRGGEWHDLRIPAPGDVCGEPHSSKAGVFCQDPSTHNQTSWTHHAIVDGCRHTWNTLRRDLTPAQVQQNMADFRRLADEQAAEIARLRAELAVAKAAGYRQAADNAAEQVALHGPDADAQMLLVFLQHGAELRERFAANQAAAATAAQEA